MALPERGSSPGFDHHIDLVPTTRRLSNNETEAWFLDQVNTYLKENELPEEATGLITETARSLLNSEFEILGKGISYSLSRAFVNWSCCEYLNGANNWKQVKQFAQDYFCQPNETKEDFILQYYYSGVFKSLECGEE